MASESTQLPFVRLFNTPTARVLDLLIANTDLQYNEEEISKLTKMSSDTLQRALKVLMEEEIIKRKKQKHSFYYEANRSSSRTNSLAGYVTSTMLSNFEQATRPTHKTRAKASVYV